MQMQALDDVVKAGYVRYVGMSSCYAYQCECFVIGKQLEMGSHVEPFSPSNAKSVILPKYSVLLKLIIMRRLCYHPQPYAVYLHAEPV